MANLSEDIQCVGSDTRPPMLDRTDFASWQQCIRLYCQGKENGDNVKMLLEGSELTKEDRESQMYDDFEHFRQNKGETIPDYYVRFTKLINDMRNIKMTMPKIQLNSKFVNNMLPEQGRFVPAVKQNRGLKESNYDQLYAYLKQHEAHANDTQLDSRLSPTENLIENLTNTLALLTQSYKTCLPQTNNQLRTSSNIRNQATIQDGMGAGAASNGGVQNRARNANPGQARQIKCHNCNGGHDTVVDEDVDEPPVQDLALNVDNVFQANECDAFDSNVDEAPIAQTMFMANLSSADPVYDEAGPSYDSDILSEVHDHDNYQDAVCEHHEVHEMHDDVQPNCIVDSDAEYTGDSNMIPYDQYVKDNAKPVVQNNVSSVPNDAYMMIINEMHDQTAQCVSVKAQNKVVDASLTAELATYKEQVELYERRAKFELTEREQKIEEQLRIVITDRNIKEENLKKELHSVKMQLNSTINHNKSMDVLKIKAKALKEQTKASRPIKALTVYPTNTPVTLIPRVLPTKSQVKINIFALIQLFLEFEKTYKKRITPTGLTEGESVFEQTKECYLTEVIPFFKTLKEHFEGIQKALTKEIKEMKEIFEELEAEVDQNVVNRKFTEMHDAHTVVKACCLELEAEISKLNDKIQKDDHTKLVKRFSNLEVNHLNLQLKYQHLKESFRNNKSLPARDAPNFDSVFVIEKMKASIQGKDNAIKKLRIQIPQLKETRSEADRTLDFRVLDFQITQLTENVTVLQEQNELFRAENAIIKQH
ncbi:hypothetical protein Tco_1082577 [Tanacetum coccineum]|uniref:Integrase, catalytic region, zinc finger, CCHC-type, peptidase aspartic, catalytic n=1 Tax=Tanacetum coccineum TaxID=301880 RepID=A0ABQ5I2H0_9ASTR